MARRPVPGGLFERATRIVDDAIGTAEGRVVFVSGDATFLFDEIANLALTRPGMVPIRAAVHGEHPVHFVHEIRRGR